MLRNRKMRRRGNVANFNTATLERDQEVDLSSLSDVEQEQYLFNVVAENIENAETSGLIDADEADDLRAELADEYSDRIKAVMGVDYDDDDDDDEDDEDDEYDDEDDEAADYGDFTPLATFRAATSYSDELLRIGGALGYQGVEQLAVDLAKNLGIDPNDALGLLSGEYAPDEELEEAIADVFGFDDQTYEALGELAEDARALAEGGDEDLDDDELEEARYAAYHGQRVEDLESQLAEFQAQKAVSSRLNQLERTAENLISTGLMPPVAATILFGTFELEDDRIAAFSQICARNKVDPDVELYAIEKAMSLFRRSFEGNPIARFGSEIQEPIDPREEDQTSQVLTQAQRNHNLRKSRGGHRVAATS